MKIACRCVPFNLRWIGKTAQMLILLLLIGLLAACPAPPPPTAVPEEEPTSAPTAEAPVEPTPDPLACTSPAQSEEPIPYIRIFQPSSVDDSAEYYEFSATSIDRDDLVVRVRIPTGGEISSLLRPIELCPLTSNDNCGGQSDLTGEQVGAVQELAPGALELIRFEIVRIDESGDLKDEGVVPGGSIQVTFAPPIELWAQFDESSLELVGSTIAQDAPRTGYWSCVDNLFNWEEFSIENNNLRVVIERADQVSLTLIPMQETSARDAQPDFVPVLPESDMGEIAQNITDALPSARVSATGGPVVTIGIGDPNTFSIKDFLGALEDVGVLGEGEGMSYKMFAVVNIDQWNDPAVGMEP